MVEMATDEDIEMDASKVPRLDAIDRGDSGLNHYKEMGLFCGYEKIPVLFARFQNQERRGHAQLNSRENTALRNEHFFDELAMAIRRNTADNRLG